MPVRVGERDDPAVVHHHLETRDGAVSSDRCREISHGDVRHDRLNLHAASKPGRSGVRYKPGERAPRWHEAGPMMGNRPPGPVVMVWAILGSNQTAADPASIVLSSTITF